MHSRSGGAAGRRRRPEIAGARSPETARNGIAHSRARPVRIVISVGIARERARRLVPEPGESTL